MIIVIIAVRLGYFKSLANKCPFNGLQNICFQVNLLWVPLGNFRNYWATLNYSNIWPNYQWSVDLINALGTNVQLFSCTEANVLVT